MQDEEWRPIPGYPDYLASSHGRIVSFKKPGQPREMQGALIRGGYRNVQLSHQGQARCFTFQRVIAAAFLGPRPDGCDVLHWDGDPLNNVVTNLRYGTHSENMYDKQRHGTDHNLNKTHCPQGHPYDEENTYNAPSGGRRCKECTLEHGRRYRARKRAAA